jgi:hypothetical protein
VVGDLFELHYLVDPVVEDCYLHFLIHFLTVVVAVVVVLMMIHFLTVVVVVEYW